MSDIKVLPCPNPWCKSSKPLIEEPDCTAETFAVSCTCGVRTPEYETEGEATSAWNTRAQSPAFDAMKTALHDFLGKATDGRDVPEWLRDEVVKLDAALKLAKEAPIA